MKAAAKPTRTDLDLKMGTFIVDREARRDKRGRLMVYPLPKGDGGGTFEVAGINDRYHPQAAKQLKALIVAKSFDLAEQSAREYILAYTDVVEAWSPNAGVEAFLRDCAFNRGPVGAAKITQIALGFEGADLDGRVGPMTRAAIAKIEPRAFIHALRAGREAYEKRVAPPKGARAKFWKGLVNRWDAARDFALTLV